MLEARFLLRQFSDEIDAGQRQALEQEVKRLLAEVERLRHQARTAAAGNREEAVQLYRDIEQLVADLPGLAEERAAVAGAESILSRLAGQNTGEWQPVPADGLVSTPEQQVMERDPPAVAGQAESKARQQTADPAGQETANPQTARRCCRSARLWLAVVGCAGLLAVLLLLIWQERMHKSPAMPPAPVSLPGRDVVTRSAGPGSSVASPYPPSEAPSPAAAERTQTQPQTPSWPVEEATPSAEKPSPSPEEPAPSSPSPSQAEPSADQTVAPPPALQLGTLQVEGSNRQPKRRPHRK